MIISTLLTYESISQTTTANVDSCTCIPDYQLKEAIKDVERGKLSAQENKIKDSLLTLANRRIANFNQIIEEHKQKDIKQDSTIAALKLINTKWEAIDKNKSSIINNQGKTIKKQRLQITWNRIQKPVYAAVGFLSAFLIFK